MSVSRAVICERILGSIVAEPPFALTKSDAEEMSGACLIERFEIGLARVNEVDPGGHVVRGLEGAGSLGWPMDNEIGADDFCLKGIESRTGIAVIAKNEPLHGFRLLLVEDRAGDEKFSVQLERE